MKQNDIAGKVNEGWYNVPPINKERYSERPGLEGPFQTRVGKVVYYDPVEGSYYDPDTDIYLSYDEYKALDENSDSQKRREYYSRIWGPSHTSLKAAQANKNRTELSGSSDYTVYTKSDVKVDTTAAKSKYKEVAALFTKEQAAGTTGRKIMALKKASNELADFPRYIENQAYGTNGYGALFTGVKPWEGLSDMQRAGVVRSQAQIKKKKAAINSLLTKIGVSPVAFTNLDSVAESVTEGGDDGFIRVSRRDFEVFSQKTGAEWVYNMGALMLNGKEVGYRKEVDREEDNIWYDYYVRSDMMQESNLPAKRAVSTKNESSDSQKQDDYNRRLSAALRKAGVDQAEKNRTARADDKQGLPAKRAVSTKNESSGYTQSQADYPIVKMVNGRPSDITATYTYHMRHGSNPLHLRTELDRFAKSLGWDDYAVVNKDPGMPRIAETDPGPVISAFLNKKPIGEDGVTQGSDAHIAKLEKMYQAAKAKNDARGEDFPSVDMSQIRDAIDAYKNKLGEADRLNELSRKTVGNYARAAIDDRNKHDKLATQFGNFGHEYSRDGAGDRADDMFRKAGQHAIKAGNRRTGLNKAIDRMVFGPRDLDETQLNEYRPGVTVLTRTITLEPSEISQLRQIVWPTGIEMKVRHDQVTFRTAKIKTLAKILNRHIDFGATDVGSVLDIPAQAGPIGEAMPPTIGTKLIILHNGVVIKELMLPKNAHVHQVAQELSKLNLNIPEAELLNAARTVTAGKPFSHGAINMHPQGRRATEMESAVTEAPKQVWSHSGEYKGGPARYTGEQSLGMAYNNHMLYIVHDRITNGYAAIVDDTVITKSSGKYGKKSDLIKLMKDYVDNK